MDRLEIDPVHNEILIPAAASLSESGVLPSFRRNLSPGASPGMTRIASCMKGSVTAFFENDAFPVGFCRVLSQAISSFEGCHTM